MALKKCFIKQFVIMSLCITLTYAVHTDQKVETMNYQPKESWLNPENTDKKNGLLNAYDHTQQPIKISWQKSSPIAQDFAHEMKKAWQVAEPAYMDVEMQFLHKHPEVVGKEPYFKSFETLFTNGPEAVDWALAETLMQKILSSHFIFDPSLINEKIKSLYENDIVYSITACDESSMKLLGFITFLIRTSYAHGDVKVMSFAVNPAEQGKGIGKLLMSSILSIIPEITRIFLCTRVTNDQALRAYRSWGFTTDATPVLDHNFNLAHWTFLEYKVAQNDILEAVNRTLKTVQE